MLRSAGAVVLGKTVTTEFALFTPGKTANPRNLAHSPGGSSSGSAAAVADGMVPLAIGAQTGGSVIRPAAYCGVVGYKPTFGMIDPSGVLAIAHSMDTVGMFAQSVSEVSLLAAVMSGRGGLGLQGSVRAPRIGLYRTHHWMEATSEARNVMLAAGESLAAAGAVVTEVSAPPTFFGLVQAHDTVVKFEAARAFAHERNEHANALGTELREFLDEGFACPPRDYDGAVWAAGQARGELRRLFEGLDVLLTLSAIGEAPRGPEPAGDVFNGTWTLLHAPCVHLPITVGRHGLPLGVQLVGAPGNDDRFLRVARWAEERLMSDHA